MSPFTHSDLVKLAARWLGRKHAVVITEAHCGAGEEPDAIGFRMGFSTLVECKVSRADFHREKNKTWNRGGRPQMGDFRYYLIPPGILSIEDLPENWGLLIAQPLGVQMGLEAKAAKEKDGRGEQQLLTSCLRRIGAGAPEGISIKCYAIQTKCKATLGVKP